MRVAKKLIAFGLAVVMLLSLCACQSNTNKKFFEILGEAQSFKAGTFTTTLSVDTEMSDEELLSIGSTFGIYPEDNHVNMTFTFDGKVDTDKNAFDVNVYLSIADSEPALITNIVGVDNNLYVNMLQVVNGLASLPAVKEAFVEQLSEEVYNGIVGFVKGIFEGKEYVVFEAADMSIESLNFGSYLTIVKDSDFYKSVWNVVEETVLDFEPSAIEKEDNAYTLTLTGENFEAIRNVILDYSKENGEQLYNLLHDIASANKNQMAGNIYDMIDSNFYNEFNEYPYDNDEAIKIIESNKDNIIAGIENSVSPTGYSQPKGTVSITVSSENGVYTTVTTVTDGETNVVIETKAKSEAVEITAPTNCISFKDLMADFSGSLGLGGLTDDWDFDADFDFSDGNYGYDTPSIVPDDAWTFNSDILMSDIEDEDVFNAVDKWRQELTKDGYTGFLLNYSYGSYELEATNEEGLVVEIEFDTAYGSKTSDYIYSIEFTLESNRTDLERDYFLDRMEVEIFKVLNKRLPKAELSDELDKEENAFGDFVTGYVYGESESYYGTWRQSDGYSRQMTISVYFD